MEQDVVTPARALFHERCMDDKYARRKKNKADTLFNSLNSYHKNMKQTIDVNPTKFLDTKTVDKIYVYITEK